MTAKSGAHRAGSAKWLLRAVVARHPTGPGIISQRPESAQKKENENLLLVRHLLLEAMHLFLVASCF